MPDEQVAVRHRQLGATVHGPGRGPERFRPGDRRAGAMGGLARRLVRQRRRPCRAGRRRGPGPGAGTETAGEAWIRAALSYHFGKFVWMLDMARHDLAAEPRGRGHGQRAPPARPGRRADRDSLRRRRHGRQPAPPGGHHHRPPLVLLIAGLDSTKEEFFAAVERLLTDRRGGWRPSRWTGPGRRRPRGRCASGPDFEATGGEGRSSTVLRRAEKNLERAPGWAVA